jgi:hypothetical protein
MNSACLIAFAALAVPLLGYAEKMDCSGWKIASREVSNESIKPGDRPDRELVQFVHADKIGSKNPEWNEIEETVYGHIDQVGGAGIHTGYAVITLKSGEKLWNKFEGAHYVTTKPDDSWEFTYVGVFRFITGTGKYKAIRGGGHYRGTVTPNGLGEEFSCEAEF